MYQFSDLLVVLDMAWVTADPCAVHRDTVTACHGFRALRAFRGKSAVRPC